MIPKVGDLVRYKHDKPSMGILIKVCPEREGDTLLVAWQTRRGHNENTQWCVSPQWIQVKGDGRFGWKDADESG